MRQDDWRRVSISSLAFAAAAARGVYPFGQLLAHQASRWLELEPQNAVLATTYTELPSDFINFQHDPLTCAVAGGWTGVTTETIPLVVVDQEGWLIERRDPQGEPLRVGTAVQAEKFHTFWLDQVTQHKIL